MKSSPRAASGVGRCWASVGEHEDSLDMERRVPGSWGRVTVDFGPFLPRVTWQPLSFPALHPNDSDMPPMLLPSPCPCWYFSPHLLALSSWPPWNVVGVGAPLCRFTGKESVWPRSNAPCCFL